MRKVKIFTERESHNCIKNKIVLLYNCRFKRKEEHHEWKKKSKCIH